MITAKIDVSKIDKSALYKGKKGTYLNVTLIEREDDFGNSHMVFQDIGKERREAGEKGPILGNGRTITHPDTKKAEQAPPKPAPQSPVEDDEDLPF